MVNKSKDGMYYGVVVITPEIASELLETAEFGDTVGASYRARVDFYAETMRIGLWRLNGDTIIVSSQGKLLDGRARLQACIQADIAFPAIVVRNVDDRALITIDAHMKRSARDILTVKDDAIPTSVASAWPIVIGYVNAPNRARFRPHGKATVTPPDIALLAAKHTELTDCASVIRDLRIPTKGMDLPKPVAAAALYLLGLADAAKARRFFEILADETADDRAVTPLRRILKDALGHHHSNTARLALVVKAWNKYIDGKPITTRALRYDGIVERIGGTSGQEAFPAIAGFPDVKPFDIEALRREDGGASVGKVASRIVGSSTIRIRRIRVTPEMAARYLQNNGPMGRNRSLRQNHVQRLAEDMRDGRWLYNGKPIKVSRDDVLLDGQHRCSACVRSGMSFETLVIEGLADTDFGTYDQGRRQGAGVQMTRVGKRYGGQHAACATTLWRMDRNLVGGEPSATAAREFIEANPTLSESIQLVDPYKHIVQTGISAALHTTFARVDRKAADEFMLALCKGSNLDAGSPILELRAKFIDQKSRKVRLAVHADTIRAIIGTWNACRGHMVPFVPGGPDGRNYPAVL